MTETDIKIIGALVGMFAIYFLYSTIRMLVDPEYNKRIQEQATKEKQRRNRHKRSKTHDPLDTDMFGNPIYPDEYKKAKNKEWNEFLDNI